MTIRRTLDLPDAPGVWIWRHWNDEQPGASVYVLHCEDGDLVYDAEHNGYLLPVANLTEEYSSGQWQGPIEWEDSNAKNT